MTSHKALSSICLGWRGDQRDKCIQRGITALLLAIIIVGALVRLYKLDASYWADEIDTCQSAHESLWFNLTNRPNPVAYVLSYLTVHLGDSEPYVRLPSFLAGVLSIPALFALGSSVYNRRAGLLAAFLLACSPFCVHVSHEARFYSIEILLATLALLLLVRLARKPGMILYALWSIVSALGLLTHPSFLIFLAGACGGFGLWLFRTRTIVGLKERVKSVSMFSLFTVAGLTPFIAASYVALMVLLSSDAAVQSAAPESFQFARNQLRRAITPTEYAADLRAILDGMLPYGVAAVYGCGGLGLVAAAKKSAAFCLPAAFIFFLTPIPLFVIKVGHFYSYRYFAYLAPAVIVAASVGIVFLTERIPTLLRISADSRPDRNAKLVLAVQTFLFFITLVVAALTMKGSLTDYFMTQWPNADWRAVARYMGLRITPHDAIYYMEHSIHASADGKASYYRDEAVQHYLKEYTINSNLLLENVTQDNGMDAEALRALMMKYPSSAVWLVCAENTLPKDVRDELDTLCDEKPITGNATLRVIGEPTTNLVSDGGFEQPRAPSEEVSMVSGDNAYAGMYSAQITNSERGHVVHLDFAVGGANSGAMFSAGRVYTFSCFLKLIDVKPGEYWSQVAKMVCSGLDANGKEFWTPLLLARGTSGWQQYSAQIIPGQTIPADAKNVTVSVGLYGGVGRLCVDNVQVEEKPYATPFVDGTRPAHDVRLRSLQGKPGA